jgi:hypothetical protein
MIPPIHSQSPHNTYFRYHVLGYTASIANTISVTMCFLPVDVFSERKILKKNRRRCSLVRRGRSAVWGRTVRDMEQGLEFPA